MKGKIKIKIPDNFREKYHLKKEIKRFPYLCLIKYLIFKQNPNRFRQKLKVSKAANMLKNIIKN